MKPVACGSRRDHDESLMITVRPAYERGRSLLDWLDSRHTFSFAEYYDARHLGVGDLRVINDDKIAAGRGFGSHPHRDMEIVTFVLQGSLEHKDNMGNGSVIRPGDVQRMSAGTGVRHSEFNPSRAEPVHFLQIWLTPAKLGLPPSYEQKAFGTDEKRGRLRIVASPGGDDGSVRLHQDTRIFAVVLDAADRVAFDVPPGRKSWVQVARGRMALNGVSLEEGDGAAVEAESGIELVGRGASEALVFDLR
jgi:redox-sensitive bicupin YhaK (pirin superfamily)